MINRNYLQSKKCLAWHLSSFLTIHVLLHRASVKYRYSRELSVAVKRYFGSKHVVSIPLAGIGIYGSLFHTTGITVFHGEQSAASERQTVRLLSLSQPYAPFLRFIFTVISRDRDALNPSRDRFVKPCRKVEEHVLIPSIRETLSTLSLILSCSLFLSLSHLFDRNSPL